MFKFILWSCGTKRMDFGFHEILVKMTKLCLEDEVIVRGFFLPSRNSTLCFAVYFEV